MKETLNGKVKCDLTSSCLLANHRISRQV